MALGRVNLSRAPHCPAAFSLGNEVMETRLDLPFLRRTTYNFTPFFFSGSLSLPSFRRFASASFPSSVLSFYPLVTDRTSVCRNRIKFAVSSTSCVYSAQRVQRGKGLREFISPNRFVRAVYTSYILDFSPKIKPRTNRNLRERS